AAYRAGRKDGRSRIGAMLGLFGAGRQRAIMQLRDAWNGTTGWSIGKMLRGGVLGRIGGLLALGPALVLFAIWLVLDLLGAIAVAFLTGFIVVFGGLFLVVSKIFTLISVLPLKLMGVIVDGARTVYEHMLRASLKVGPAVLLIMVALAIHAGTMLPKL